MAVLIFGLVVLVALGNFADFLLGQTGGRRAKDRLVDFYIVINNSNWSGIFRWTGSAMYEFMSKYLGAPSSARYFFRVLILSLPASTAIGIYLMIDRQGGDAPAVNVINVLSSVGDVFVHLLPLWISGYMVDLFSWYIAHRAFARLSRSDMFGGILLVFWIVIAAYIAMVMTLFLLFTTTFLLFPENDVAIDAMFFVNTIIVSFAIVSIGLLDTTNNIANGVAVLPALIPYVLFMIILMTCTAASRAQRFVRKPLNIILQRAEESSKGIFTLVATAVAAIIGILSAADRAFH